MIEGGIEVRRRIGWLVVLAIFSSPAGGWAAQDVSDRDRFELFNACRPMDLIVESLHADAAEIGLTEESIQAAVESRLRSARLYDADAVPYLYVNVNVAGSAFARALQYKKIVYDQVAAVSGFATTWEIKSAGTHGGDAAYILAGIARHMDRFLVEYLRVNESACD